MLIIATYPLFKIRPINIDDITIRSIDSFCQLKATLKQKCLRRYDGNASDKHCRHFEFCLLGNCKEKNDIFYTYKHTHYFLLIKNGNVIASRLFPTVSRFI